MEKTKMKKIIKYSSITIVLVITVFCFNAYSKNKDSESNLNTNNLAVSNNTIGVINDDIKYEIIDSHLSLTKKYHSINELKKDSTIIVEGIVKNTTSPMIEDIPYTVSKVEIVEIFKNDGTLEKGENICVIETGGIFSPEVLLNEHKKKFPNEAISLKDMKPTKLITDGIAPMDINEHVIIFALQTPPLDGKPCYAPVGEYQGKYKLEDSKWKQQIPKEFEGGYKDKIKSKDEIVDMLR